MARPKSPKLPPGKFPHAAERKYARALRDRVRKTHAAVLAELSGPLAVLWPPDDTRQDAAERRLDAVDDPRALLRVIRQARVAFEADNPPDKDAVDAVAKAVSRFTRDTLERQLSTLSRRTDAVDFPTISLFEDDPRLRDQFQLFATENVSLIKSIDDRYFDDVSEVVREGVENAWILRKLSERLQERFGVSKSRAELIARDQVGKLHGQLTKTRQETIGITEFQWSSSGDSRVRDAHAKANGKTYSWTKGHPTEGFPGQPIACRCVATPVMPDWYADDEPEPTAVARVEADPIPVREDIVTDSELKDVITKNRETLSFEVAPDYWAGKQAVNGDAFGKAQFAEWRESLPGGQKVTSEVANAEALSPEAKTLFEEAVLEFERTVESTMSGVLPEGHKVKFILEDTNGAYHDARGIVIPRRRSVEFLAGHVGGDRHKWAVKTLKNTLMHEFGHYLEEENAAIGDAAKRFFMARKKGRARKAKGRGVHLEQRAYLGTASKLAPGLVPVPGNDRENGFFHDYMGVLYTNKERGAIGFDDIQATEITSIAFETFESDDDAANMWALDADLFAYTNAVLRGEFGYRPKGKK